MDNIKRAALYIRVSTDEQAREGYSLEAQKDNLIKYAKENNYTIVDIYADEGISARKSYKNRKEFMRMLEDVKSQKIDLILFIKLDRYFRNIGDYYKIQDILEKYNVGWKATLENYDTTTANGRFYVNIRLSMAQDEADRTSERIKFVFDNKVKKGEIISGSVPYGYKIKDKHLIIDEDKAEVVRYVFQRYSQIRSKRSTVVDARNKFQNGITYKILDTMIRNEIYIGKYRDNFNYCEPIISTELFEEVQELLKQGHLRYGKKTNNNFEYNYIFSGLVHCPSCKKIMASSKTLGFTRKNGEEVYYFYYRCMNKMMQKSCDYCKMVNEQKLEKYLLDTLFQKLKRYKVDYQLKENKKIVPDLEQKKIIQNKIKRLQDLYVNELIEIEDYKKQYSKLQEELSKFKDVKITKKKDFSQIDNILNSDYKEIYKKLNNVNKRIFWHSIIKEIYPIPNTENFKIIFK